VQIINEYNFWLVVIATIGVVITQYESKVSNKLILLLISSFMFVYVLIETPITKLYYRWDDIMFIILLGYLILTGNKKIFLSKSLWIKLNFILVFCILFLFTGILYIPPLSSFLSILLLVKLGFIYAIGSFYSGNEKNIYKIIYYSVIVLILVAVLQGTGQLEDYMYIDSAKRTRTLEATSLLGYNTAHYGLYIIIGAFSAFQLFIKDSKVDFGALKYTVTIFLFMMGSLLSDNRATFIGLIVFSMITIIYVYRKYLIQIFLLLIILTSAGVLDNIQNFEIGERVLGDIYESWTSTDRLLSANERVNISVKTYDYVAQYPHVLITGVGYNGWSYQLMDATHASSAHNQFINILMEVGFLGLFSFILFLFFSFIKLEWSAKLFLGCLILISLTGEYILPRPAFENASFLIFFLLGLLSKYKRKSA
jgi:O-antigen ligase